MRQLIITKRQYHPIFYCHLITRVLMTFFTGISLEKILFFLLTQPDVCLLQTLKTQTKLNPKSILKRSDKNSPVFFHPKGPYINEMLNLGNDVMSGLALGLGLPL